jgi:2-polyprenyl-3-methyl-5-hydroxy-6-metoxy-1,4-benzoquinol methylase
MTNDLRRLFYERFAGSFDEVMNAYDLGRRLELVFGKFLTKELAGARVLDAGCGTGHFSRAAVERGARVVSLDLGQALLAQVAKKCASQGVVGSVLALPFRAQSFDVVICSEVIEHTEDPYRVIPELHRVLREGGVLALTVPNQTWKWSCILAGWLNLRPYRGLENWVRFAQLKRTLRETGFAVEDYRGFHLFPFMLPLAPRVLPVLDRWGTRFGAVYINIGAKCLRPAARAMSEPAQTARVRVQREIFLPRSATP